MRAHFILPVLIAAMPAMSIAQTVTTPLPSVPLMQPLYPRAGALSAPAAQAITQQPERLASTNVQPSLPSFAAPETSLAVSPQPVQPVAASAILPAAQFLPPNTDILVRLNEEVSSKGRKVGDSFRLTVVQDIMAGGVIVIPRGTPVFGSVAWRTGKGMFGKSAKMEITIDRLDLAGRTLPLSGRFREEGDGNTGATIGTAVAAGLIAAAFVTGRSAVFPAGREFRVSTREAFALRAMPARQMAASSTAAPNE